MQMGQTTERTMCPFLSPNNSCASLSSTTNYTQSDSEINEWKIHYQRYKSEAVAALFLFLLLALHSTLYTLVWDTERYGCTGNLNSIKLLFGYCICLMMAMSTHKHTPPVIGNRMDFLLDWDTGRMCFSATAFSRWLADYIYAQLYYLDYLLHKLYCALVWSVVHIN